MSLELRKIKTGVEGLRKIIDFLHSEDNTSPRTMYYLRDAKGIVPEERTVDGKIVVNAYEVSIAPVRAYPIDPTKEVRDKLLDLVRKVHD